MTGDQSGVVVNKVRSYIIRGELSGPQAIAFAEKVASTSLEGVTRVELSMARASKLDVSGVAVLVRMYSQLLREGRELVLTDVSGDVAAQLRLIGLSRVLASEAASPRPTRALLGWLTRQPAA